MWCEVRDRVKAATADWPWVSILLYLGIVVIFIYAAYQTYYKYILPRLDPDFVPNREFIYDRKTFRPKIPGIPGIPGSGDDGNAGTLMFFCVKWCPHCKRAEPEWNKVVNKFQGKKIGGHPIFFQKIDCEDEEEFSNDYNIEGYPTIKLVIPIEGEEDTIIEFNAKPDAATIEEFLKEQMCSSLLSKCKVT